MNEKEKMLNGLLYYSSDEKLVSERRRARELIYKFNHISPYQSDERKRIIKRLFGQVGNNFSIGDGFKCDYGYNIFVGENFYANYNCVILDCAKVDIGDNVFIAPNVGIYTAGHPLDVERRNSGLEYAYPITIGNNVWIGANVVILPNVEIGDNTVIGAGSVITKNIPSNVLAVGNPCKVIKNI